MRSSELVNLISGNLAVKDVKIKITPQEVYAAGSLAQQDILNYARPIERTGYLSLVVGQDRYQFEEVAISGVTEGAPATITSNNHPFHTGDTVTIFGVIGISGVNGRRQITKVDANSFTLDNSTGTGTYTSGGYAYHDLMSMLVLKGCYYSTSPFGELKVLSKGKLEAHRMKVEYGGSTTSDLIEVTQVYDKTMMLQFRGTPTEDRIMELLYDRSMMPSDELSLTVDPILPYLVYDVILIEGTKYHLLNMKNESAAKDVAREMLPEWRNRLLEARAIANRRKVLPLETLPERLEW